MSKVNVRYIVNDVDAAIPFYIGVLGFKLEMHPAPGKRCRKASVLLRVGGTEFRLKSTTSKPRSRS